MKTSKTKSTMAVVIALAAFVVAAPEIGAGAEDVKIVGFENDTIALFDNEGNWRKDVPVTLLGKLPVPVLSVRAEEGFLKVKVGGSNDFWVETTDVRTTPLHSVNLPCTKQVSAKASDATVAGSLGMGGGRCQ